MDDQNYPVPPQPPRSNDPPEAHGKTTQQIHELSKSKEGDKTAEQIHDLSKPKAGDKTTQQIHELSKPKPDDKTTEKIHELSNFSVSEAVGLPLLAKDIGKDVPERSRGRAAGAKVGAADWRQSYFSEFSSQDMLMFALSTVMVLGPLFFGATRG